jgi:hypothetical protein
MNMMPQTTAWLFHRAYSKGANRRRNLDGDTIQITITDPALAGGEDTVSETVPPTIATALAADINSNTDLADNGITASAFVNVLVVESQSANITSYNAGISGPGAAAVSITSGLCVNSALSALITGIGTAGDVLSITVLDVGLAGGIQSPRSSQITESPPMPLPTCLQSSHNPPILRLTAPPPPDQEPMP